MAFHDFRLIPTTLILCGQFHDGVYLVKLIGIRLMQGYFMAFHNCCLFPTTLVFCGHSFMVLGRVYFVKLVGFRLLRSTLCHSTTSISFPRHWFCLATVWWWGVLCEVDRIEITIGVLCGILWLLSHFHNVDFVWPQFHDGVYLVMLMGLLEGYFVPLHNFHLTPTTFEQKVRIPGVSCTFSVVLDLVHNSLQVALLATVIVCVIVQLI